MRFRDKRQHRKHGETLIVTCDRYGNVTVRIGSRVETGVSENRVRVLSKRNKQQRGGK